MTAVPYYALHNTILETLMYDLMHNVQKQATEKIIVEFKKNIAIPDYAPHSLPQNLSRHLLVQDLIHHYPEVSK